MVHLQGKQLRQQKVRRAASTEERPDVLRERAASRAPDLRRHRHVEGLR